GAVVEPRRGISHTVQRASRIKRPGVAFQGHWQRVRGLDRHRNKNAEATAPSGVTVSQCSSP
ncbi:hypothetical protein, partial [Halomonas sp. 3F2F]|uniref:hypothetical protein n=1 Tax=Halomonas sp. 3F2F TaxID=1255602 RepID=UPI001D003D18